MADGYEPIPVGKGVAVSGDAGAPRALFMPGTFAEAMRVAEIMADGNMVPKHLRGKPGDCLAVLIQSARWGMDPWAVGNSSFFVNDRMAYESKLISAVINSSGILESRLRPVWEGEGEKMKCTVTGKIKGEREPFSIMQELATITTRNSPLWKQSPRQQLGYYTTRLWTRLYAPEVLLGVYDVDEAAGIEPRAGQVLTAPPLRSAKVERIVSNRTPEQSAGIAEAIDQATASGAVVGVADAVDAIFNAEPEDDDGRLPGEQDDGEQIDEETGEVVPAEQKQSIFQRMSEVAREATAAVEAEAVAEPKRRGRPPKSAPPAEPSPVLVAAVEADTSIAAEPANQEVSQNSPAGGEPVIDARTKQPIPATPEAWDSYILALESLFKIKSTQEQIEALIAKNKGMYDAAPKHIQKKMEDLAGFHGQRVATY